MTQAAVSQHVAPLEAELGVALFLRRHRGVELTAAGAAFLDTVQHGLKTLADGVASARRQAGGKTIRLLHLRGTSGRRWFDWADWFASNGVARAAGRHELIFDNAELVLQATLLGRGASIGWVPLIDDLVASGAVVRLAAEPLRSRREYFVVGHIHRPYAANVATLKTWLLASRPGRETYAPDSLEERIHA